MSLVVHIVLSIQIHSLTELDNFGKLLVPLSIVRDSYNSVIFSKVA